MSKKNKIFIIVGLSLFAAGIITLVVFLNIMPISTREFLKNAWAWLNNPLPVVGFSTLMVIFFVWRIFLGSSFGKKQINEFKRESALTREQFEELKKDYESKIAAFEELIATLDGELAVYKDYLKKVCKSSPNAKIKKIGVELERTAG